MALLEKHLVVKKSQLPQAGKGLYTKVDIKKGKRIVEYKGERTTWKEVKDDDGKNGYIFYINRNVVIDAWRTTDALGRYANDALGAVRLDGFRNNSEYVISGKRCYIVARKNIPAGSEIFVGYGADYWKTMVDNWKLDKKKGKKKKKKKKKGAGKQAKSSGSGKSSGAVKRKANKKKGSAKKASAKQKR